MAWQYAEYAVRLILAIICGGYIGYERESSNHPAGLRTHILVCVASTLVLVTSDYAFMRYSSIVNLDPMRLGAQIISGIGFLGAGAIMKEGVTVKGLTTAACLWAVACIGIALGVGFYYGALLTTVLIYIVLIFFRKLEDGLTRGKAFHVINIEIQNINKEGVLKAIEDTFSAYHTKLHKVTDIAVENTIYIRYELFLYKIIPKDALVRALVRVDGVLSVSDTETVSK